MQVTHMRPGYLKYATVRLVNLEQPEVISLGDSMVHQVSTIFTPCLLSPYKAASVPDHMLTRRFGRPGMRPMLEKSRMCYWNASVSNCTRSLFCFLHSFPGLPDLSLDIAQTPSCVNGICNWTLSVVATGLIGLV
jgi:hypothetical protein